MSGRARNQTQALLLTVLLSGKISEIGSSREPHPTAVNLDMSGTKLHGSTSQSDLFTAE